MSTTRPIPKKIIERKKRQTDIPPPYQDPLSDPPPLSEPPLSPQLPLSDPPESHEPLSEPPESHEPLSEPPESHHESPLLLPESDEPLEPPLHQEPPLSPLPDVTPEAISPEAAQIAERMQRTSAMAKKGAARFIRFMSCLQLRRRSCGVEVIPLSREDEHPADCGAILRSCFS
jgi:hypothetical protein